MSNFLSVFICSQFLDNLSPLNLNIHKNLRYQRDLRDFSRFPGFLKTFRLSTRVYEIFGVNCPSVFSVILSVILAKISTTTEFLQFSLKINMLGS